MQYATFYAIGRIVMRRTPLADYCHRAYDSAEDAEYWADFLNGN